MNILIPVSVLDKLNNDDYQPKLKKRLIELWYFIYNRQIEDYDNTLDYYVNIHVKDLCKFDLMIDGERYRYNNLLSILNKCELIDINEKYSSGSFSMSYRINTSVINIGYAEVEVDFKKIFKYSKTQEYWLQKYPELLNKIQDLYSTTIDLEEYYSYLTNNIGLQLKPIYNKKTKRLEKRVLTPQRVFEYLTEAIKINFQNIWIKISEEGRLYSSITNISSTATPFIKIDGKKTYELDVKNCQPLLLATIIQHDKYKQDVENGIFYDKLANVLLITRDEAKLRVYRHVLFNDDKLSSGNLYNALEVLYTGLVDQINTLKEKGNIALMLQKIESDIFIKSTEYRQGFVTKHDGVIVDSRTTLFLLETHLKQEFKDRGLDVVFTIN